MIRKASAKFFSKSDPNCIARREKLPTTLRDDYSKFFNDPTESEADSPFGGLLSLSAQSQSWSPTEKGMFWVGNSQFTKIEVKNIYNWETVVTFARLYRRDPAGISPTPQSSERILILPFSISWHAQVTTDARFRNVTLGPIKLGEYFSRSDRRRLRNLWLL